MPWPMSDPLPLRAPRAPSIAILPSDALPPEVMEPVPRRRLLRHGDADYRLGDEIGRGGEGVVLKALQAGLGRTVAVKRLLRGGDRSGASMGAGSQRRFLAEAAITGRLEHPNIVPVHELGFDQDGDPFFIMKFVQGKPWLDDIPFRSEAENLDVLLRVCDAVAYAHDRGIIHRDLKPENVLLGEFGEVQLVDWGMAVDLERLRASKATLTEICGTPSYMAPEQASGDAARLGIATDIYLLGGMLHEIAVGLPPRTGEDPKAILAKAAANLLDPLPPGEMGELLHTALATEPKDRFSTVAQFQLAVRTYLTHSESRRLVVEANEALRLAERSGDYRDFTLGILRFQEALRQWEGNREARAGLMEARRGFATRAIARGDADLAMSLCDEAGPALKEIREQALATKHQREQRARTVHRLRLLSIALGTVALCAVIGGLGITAYQHQVLVTALTDRSEAEVRQAKVEVDAMRRDNRVWRPLLIETFADGATIPGTPLPADGWRIEQEHLTVVADGIAALAFDVLAPLGLSIRVDLDRTHPLRVDLGLAELAAAVEPACRIEIGESVRISGPTATLAEVPIPVEMPGVVRHLRIIRVADHIQVVIDGRQLATATLPRGIDWTTRSFIGIHGPTGLTIDNLQLERLE